MGDVKSQNIADKSADQAAYDAEQDDADTAAAHATADDIRGENAAGEVQDIGKKLCHIWRGLAGAVP